MRQIAVIGLGQFGNRVAIALTERGFEVLAVDIHKEKIDAIKDQVTHAVQIMSTTEDVFRSLGIEKVDVAVVGIGEHIEGSILTTTLLKKMGVKKIVARAINELHGDILSLVGADKVVFPHGTQKSREGWTSEGAVYDEVMNLPYPDYKIEPDDILLTIGKDENIERISRL